MFGEVGIDLVGDAALGAARRVGLVDAFDEHAPRRRSSGAGAGMVGSSWLGTGSESEHACVTLNGS